MEITYESLMQLSITTAYTDHIYHFKKLFELTKVDTFLEWGCGYSSKIFLENSKNLISIEFIHELNDNQSYWFNHCVELFGTSNWNAVLEVCSENVHNACSYQSSQHKDYALIDSDYVNELDDYIKDVISKNNVTVSFVDSGIYLRGDLVELSLQNKIPIVIAHDTANLFPDYPSLIERETDTGLYGWFKVKQHKDYEKVFLNYGSGTMFWIHKDLPDVIAGMRQYRDDRNY